MVEFAHAFATAIAVLRARFFCMEADLAPRRTIIVTIVAVVVIVYV